MLPFVPGRSRRMTTRRQPMTPLRHRMWEDLQLRNYSEHTMRAYLHCVADFAKHFGTSPDDVGPEQVRFYQLFLIQEKQRAWPTVVQAVCALRFFYRVTLKRPGMIEYIAHPHRPFTLPTIPTPNPPPSAPPSMPRACGWPNCASCRSPISTARAWCSGCGKARASRIV